MKRILIGGIGNVLLHDDGFGPYIVRTLAARYQFEDSVEIVDLGTPGFELVDYLRGRDTVILVDSVNSDLGAGTIQSYRKAEILQCGAPTRMDPHAPTLAESLVMSDFLGEAPHDMLLIGVVADSNEMGCGLSEEVSASVESVIEMILLEVERLQVRFEPKTSGDCPDIWWLDADVGALTIGGNQSTSGGR